MRLDQTDWNIINLLSEKYVSNTAVAKQLDLSEGTVRHRIKKLQDAGILKIKALRDPDLLADQQLAIVAASIQKSDQLDAKAQEIAKLENVLSVSITSGRYDLFIEVLVDSNKGLIKFLTESLAQVKGIAQTETFVTLKSYNRYI